MVRAQQVVLEETLGRAWLEANVKRGSLHPACERWRVCERFHKSGGRLRVPTELELAHSLMEVMADNLSLVQCSAGDIKSFSVGALANYGDAQVLRRLKKVLHHDTQFGDALLELSCASWHLLNKHEVMATEREGKPDLHIVIPGWSVPVFADSKRVSARTDNVIEGVIEKANRQLRNSGVCEESQTGLGIVYIDVTLRLGVLDRERGDDVPVVVQEVTDLILRRLYRHNRSVSAVVLLWRERATGTDGKIPPLVSLLLLWRCLVIRHRRPHIALPANDARVRVQGTVGLRVDTTR